MEEMILIVKSESTRDHLKILTMELLGQKIDKYGPCPCGSGRYYKWCCHNSNKNMLPKPQPSNHEGKGRTEDASPSVQTSGDGLELNGHSYQRLVAAGSWQNRCVENVRVRIPPGAAPISILLVDKESAKRVFTKKIAEKKIPDEVIGNWVISFFKESSNDDEESLLKFLEERINSYNG